MNCPQLKRLLSFLGARTGLSTRVQFRAITNHEAIFIVDGRPLHCDTMALQEYLGELPENPYSDEIVRAIQLAEI